MQKKRDDIREKFPLAKTVYEETQYAVTKTCGLVLRSEDHLHSQAKVVQMQLMMASVLQARHEAGKRDDPQNESRPEEPELVATIRPHDLVLERTQTGEQAFRCIRCDTFGTGSTRIVAQEHCDGRRREHRRFSRPSQRGAQ